MAFEVFTSIIYQRETYEPELISSCILIIPYIESSLGYPEEKLITKEKCEKYFLRVMYKDQLPEEVGKNTGCLKSHILQKFKEEIFLLVMSNSNLF